MHTYGSKERSCMSDCSRIRIYLATGNKRKKQDFQYQTEPLKDKTKEKLGQFAQNLDGDLTKTSHDELMAQIVEIANKVEKIQVDKHTQIQTKHRKT